MSTHDEITGLLDDFAGGELDERGRRAVQRHLDVCADCRAEVDALRALLDEARFLPRALAPSRDLWGGIEARLEPKGGAQVIDLASHRKSWKPPRWVLAVAAALVLVVSTAVITASVVGRGQAPGAPGEVAQATGAAPAGTAFAAFQPAEAEYQKAVDDLQAVLATRRGRMLPETARTLEANLRIIDQAIRESREALAKDPNSAELTEMLSSVYETKVRTLQQAVQL
jgi:anti-sigma-K factor RskA